MPKLKVAHRVCQASLHHVAECCVAGHYVVFIMAEEHCRSVEKLRNRPPFWSLYLVYLLPAVLGIYSIGKGFFPGHDWEIRDP